MNAAEVLIAVREAGASLRVEGDSLVASNASRIAPAIKAAIRECKPQIIAALRPACRVEIVVLPQAQRYRKVFAHLQLKPPALIPIDRWQQAVEDGKSFLSRWGEQAQAPRVVERGPIRTARDPSQAAPVLSAAIEI
jgi:hypothetical protein